MHFHAKTILKVRWGLNWLNFKLCGWNSHRKGDQNVQLRKCRNGLAELNIGLNNKPTCYYYVEFWNGAFNWDKSWKYVKLGSATNSPEGRKGKRIKRPILILLVPGQPLLGPFQFDLTLYTSQWHCPCLGFSTGKQKEQKKRRDREGQQEALTGYTGRRKPPRTSTVFMFACKKAFGGHVVRDLLFLSNAVAEKQLLCLL